MIGLLNIGRRRRSQRADGAVGSRRLARQRPAQRARQHVGRRDRRRRSAPAASASPASAKAAAVAAKASASATSAPSATAPAPAPGRASAPATAASAARTGPSRPQVRMGATQVNGRLPPEVIQRIVRQNFGRFRLCYENGLRNNPNLQGRVSVRFVIGRDGAVSQRRQRRLGPAGSAASSPASSAPSTASRSRSPKAASSPSSTRSCSRPAADRAAAAYRGARSGTVQSGLRSRGAERACDRRSAARRTLAVRCRRDVAAARGRAAVRHGPDPARAPYLGDRIAARCSSRRAISAGLPRLTAADRPGLRRAVRVASAALKALASACSSGSRPLGCEPSPLSDGCNCSAAAWRPNTRKGELR